MLWRLFPNGGTITQSELVADAKSTPKASAAWLKDFKKSVHDDAARRGYVDQGHLVKWVLHGLTIVVVGGVGAIAVGAKAPLGWVAIAVAVVLFLLSRLLRQRTDAGARKLAEVNGLAHFLNDFSRLPDEAHTGDLVLYERYLVYAVARRRRATRRRVASALPAVRGGQQRFRDVVRRGQRGGLLELQPA